MSNERTDTDPFDDELDPDRSNAGWQPLLEKPGYEQWWDGDDWRGRPHREPDPFSAFTPELARSLRPGPNRAAWFARLGIVATLAGFVVQTVVASGLIVMDGIAPLAVTLGAIGTAAALAIATAVAALPYVIITAQFWMITDETSESANRGWKRFLLLNFVAGAIVTMLMIYWATTR